jgi:hypothetical protein
MRALIVTVLVLAAAGLGWAAAPSGSAPAPAAAPAVKVPTAAEKAEAARVRAAMAAAKPQTEFANVSVKDILTYLAEVGQINIVYDKALEAAGIDLATVMASIKARGLALEDVLTLVLPRECGYRVEAGYVLITTREKSWLPLMVHSFDIKQALAEIPDFGGLAPRFQVNPSAQQGGQGGNLFAAPAAAPPAPAAPAVTPQVIIDLIKKFVKNADDPRVAPWDDEGGPANIQYFGGFLIVSQTYIGQLRTARIIAMIE